MTLLRLCIDLSSWHTDAARPISPRNSVFPLVSYTIYIYMDCALLEHSYTTLSSSYQDIYVTSDWNNNFLYAHSKHLSNMPMKHDLNKTE